MTIQQEVLTPISATMFATVATIGQCGWSVRRGLYLLLAVVFVSALLGSDSTLSSLDNGPGAVGVRLSVLAGLTWLAMLFRTRRRNRILGTAMALMLPLVIMVFAERLSVWVVRPH